ncbi:MAG: hypothetical protein WBM44_07800 [Waterburya sp.]
MDSHEPTLKSFFKDGKHAKEIAKKISKNPKFLELKRNAKKKLKGMKVPGYFYNDLPQKIIEKIDDLIDIKILDILIKAWIKCGEILKYRDTKKYPSNEVFQVRLCIAAKQFWSLRKIKVLKSLLIKDFDLEDKINMRSLMNKMSNF